LLRSHLRISKKEKQITVQVVGYQSNFFVPISNQIITISQSRAVLVENQKKFSDLANEKDAKSKAFLYLSFTIFF
jgi:ABC-type polar amino acid transport system ATPase subunit